MLEPTKIMAIVNLEASGSVKQLCTTLGHTGYYQKFIKAYDHISTHMEKLLNKDVAFYWDEECQCSLDILKETMVSTPILVFPDWNKEFHVHVDASCIALGVVLTKAGKGEMDHSITFVSRKLSTTKKNYPTIEHEGLAIVYVLQKFKHYLLGGHFKIYTNHFALKYLVNKPMFEGE